MAVARFSLAAIVSLFQAVLFNQLCLNNVRVTGLPNSFCSTELHHLLKFFDVYDEPELVLKSHLLAGSACRDVHSSCVRFIGSVLRQVPAEFAVLNSLSTKMAGFFLSAGDRKKLFSFTVATSSCDMVAADARHCSRATRLKSQRSGGIIV